MPTFRYKALGQSGALDQGVVTAKDMAGAQRQLRAQKLTPIYVSVASDLTPNARAGSERDLPLPDAETAKVLLGKVSRGTQVKKSTKRFDRDDVLRFTAEMSVLLRAGLPLDRAMKVQIESAADGIQKNLLEELLVSLKAGKALSAGLEKRPDIFNHFYINMVRSGEASGDLADVLQELAAYLERSKAVRASVIAALIYPAILAAVAALSVFVMLSYVVPEFEALFEDMGESLPLLTRAIVGLGDLVSAWGWLLLLVSVGIFLWLRRWTASAQGREWIDLKSLTVPLVGSIMLKYEVARFARTMGTLLKNGVAMLRATDIAVGTVSNSLIRASLVELPQTIKRGGRLSQALDTRVFSPVALQMVRVGEESGSLDTMLIELAQVSEAEVEDEVKRALTLLEPALILGMGGIIAVIIMGILMGILSVNTLVV
ncbi:type II secretion system F family protein [Luminiphilus sp.]|nr:type II secretion system F family protein [Luminiphilus sp.]MDA9711202.1 type II secretion system F family protein [Luminiphilus sp.]